MKLTAPNVSLGQSYVAEVHAFNGCGVSNDGYLGYSNWSPQSGVLSPVIPASPPVGVAATPGNGSAVVTWKAPASDGFSAISDYVATAIPSGLTCHSQGQLTCSFQGLTNGVAYSFVVRAVTKAGLGQPSGASRAVVPAGNPSTPRNVVATPTSGALIVSWTAPASDGGTAISHYQVSLLNTAFGCSTTGALSCTVSGLTNGTSYNVEVVASNGAGQSGPSTLVAGTPAAKPGAPTNVVATGATGSAIITWSAPTSDGGSPITSYSVVASPGGGTCTTTSQLFCTVSNLVDGKTYSFAVTAHNGQGSGPAGSTAVAVEIGIPSAPTGITVTPHEKSLLVGWQPSQANGHDITAYVVTLSPGGGQCAWTPSNGNPSAPSCTVTGLVNGTSYSVSVVAQNSIGNSRPGTSSSGVAPVGTPSAPLSVVATSGNASSLVSWTAPTYTGEPNNSPSGLTYHVVSSPGNFTCAITTTTSCVVTGLTNGTSYTFTVYATNSAPGSGLTSVATPVIEIGLPQAPTSVTASSGNASATISWTAPTSGGPIGAYVVTSSPGGYTCRTSTTSCTVTGLTNLVSYTFTVTMTNTFGTSSASTPSNSVTPGAAPAAPLSVSVTAGNGQLTVSWAASGLNGGAAVTSYTAVAAPGGRSCTTSTLTCVITGLSNFTSYTVTVVATNALSIKSSSSIGVSGTPLSPPTISMSIASVSYRNVTVNISTSVTSPDSISSVSCNWGDGNNFSVSGGNQQAGHTYGSDGTWTVSCTVKDSYNQQASTSVQVSEQAQHAITLWNGGSGSPALGLCSGGCSAQENFNIGAGVTQLTTLKLGSDIWPTYEPPGETLNLYIYVNGNLAYQGAQGQHYGGNNQVFQFNFDFGVSQGSSVSIKVTFSGVANKQADIFTMGAPSNSYVSNFSGTIFWGELDGIS